MSFLLTILLRDLFGIVLVSLSIVLLFGIGEYLRREHSVAVEQTRKLSHFGAGMVIMAFPWLFSSHWSVAFLSFNFFLLLWMGKKMSLLDSVHSVDRSTGGAYYYPMSVFVIFWLSNGEALQFCLPLAILAIADAGAALVGKKMGKRTYIVYDGKRSMEGSLTFFVLALSLSIAFLGLANRPGWPDMLLIAIAIAIFTTALEAISILGSDNLLIPYGCFLVLERSLRNGLQDLSGWFEGMFISTLIIAFTWKRTGLTEAGALSIFISGSLAWAIGDWYWSLPLASLYSIFLLTIVIAGYKPEPGHTDLEDVLPTVFGALIIILLFSHFQEDSLFIPYLTALSAGGAIALGRMASNRNLFLIPSVVVGAAGPILPLFFLRAKLPMFTISLSIVIGIACFWILRQTPLLGRRLLATLLASAFAWSLS